MIYREVLPQPLLTQHIECIWELSIQPKEANRKYEVMAPDCTFDIVFSELPILLAFKNGGGVEKIKAGGAFVGQKTGSVKLCVKKAQTVLGIRFKPFAFAHLFSFSPSRIKNRAIALDQLFDLEKSERSLIKQILKNRDLTEKMLYCEQLIFKLLKEQLYIDQTFRAQLNYILDRKGLVEVSEIFSEFGISKVTLCKHFLNKMGITPKVVSRIWRLNHFLELKKRSSKNSFTHLALESGYYDQAHFIREFKSFFRESPKHFFKEESQLLSISQGIISRRFSNQYDPVFVT